jgi:hypothetical protein
MITRHLTVPFDFYCFTENPSNLNPAIKIKPLPTGLFSGWWWKPYIFKQGHFPDGDVNLFFDLDMVIVGNIDKLVSYLPGEFVGLEDVGRVFRRVPQKLGSAVLRWSSNHYSNIWEELDTNPSQTNFCMSIYLTKKSAMGFKPRRRSFSGNAPVCVVCVINFKSSSKVGTAVPNSL